MSQRTPTKGEQFLDTATEKTASAPTQERGRVRSLLRDVAWGKIGLFGATLFLFILAITLMKDGARDLTPLVRDLFSVTNAINSLGFGWLLRNLWLVQQ